MSLPNPSMVFTPYDPLPASDLNDMVENIEALADGSAYDNGDIPINAVANLSETIFDHIASGCVWSGDAYGSTRVASMTSGVAYISGIRVPISAVTSRTFTASKDTYIDVDNTGTITYTEVSNNAASPALASNSIRLGIIVTGASNIANVGSVNQGQETALLPLSDSNTVYVVVTDTLGNLICPRDSQRKLLGYRQITSNITTTNSSGEQATGLRCPVKVPTGRKIKVSVYSNPYNTTNNCGGTFEIWEGTVGSGTQKAVGSQELITPVGAHALYVECTYTPTSSSITLNMGWYRNGGGTFNMNCTSASPAFIKVELA